MSFACFIALIASGPLSLRLADGNTVYLSYVSDVPSKRAWRPDGTLTKSYHSHSAFDRMVPTYDMNRDHVVVSFALRFRVTPRGISNRDGSTYDWQPTFAQIGPGKGLLVSAVRIPKNPRQIRRRVLDCSKTETEFSVNR